MMSPDFAEVLGVGGVGIPQVLLPVVAGSLLFFWARRQGGTRALLTKIALSIALCGGAYCAIVLAFNYSHLRHWRNVTDFLLLENGAPLGIEHPVGVLTAAVIAFKIWRPRRMAFQESLRFIRGKRLISFEEA